MEADGNARSDEHVPQRLRIDIVALRDDLHGFDIAQVLGRPIGQEVTDDARS
jgi:hypothetical protein